MSVALCTWNGARFLPELLESVSAQRVMPDEIVIGDDDSDDETVTIIERFASRSGVPVRIHRNPTRLGAIANFSATIGRCRGDSIALADQDDVWWPSKLERMGAAMAGGATLAFADAVVIDEIDEPVGYNLWDAARVDGEALDAIADGFGFDLLLDRRVVTGSCSVISSQLTSWALPVPDLLPARARRPLPHDAWLALCASGVGRVAVVREPVMSYRKHDRQAIGLPALSTVPRPAPDWQDPSTARAEADWIATVLALLDARAAPLTMPGVDRARGRARALAGLTSD